MASLSLKCGQDWLKDEEVENCKVTIIIFFGVLLLVCFEVDTSYRSGFIMMQLDKTAHIDQRLSQ